MSDKKKKLGLWPALFGAALMGYSAFTLLDAFVIPKNVIRMEDAANTARTITSVSDAAAAETDTAVPDSASDTTSTANSDSTTAAADTAIAGITNAEADVTDTASSSVTADAAKTTSSGAVITDSTYVSDSVKIEITEKTIDNTEVYIADIQVTDPSVLLAGLANGSFGQNVSEKTSSIAEEVGAVLAINGDYYGFRSTGYVMRNGYLYRSTSAGADQEDLVIYQDGTMEIIREGDISAEELQANGAVQIFSFGPGLVQNGEITVDANDEVDRAMVSNPRTAIGQISTGHYVMVVSDGRTSESAGLTLEQLAEVMKDLGCTTAYNLDGGGSSTMWFNGSVVNNPTSGHGIKERSVSDIVYIAG